MPTLVNIRHGQTCDVYIGRASHAPRPDVPGADGYFGNPVQAGVPCPICRRRHRTGETIPCFRVYFQRRLADPSFRAAVQDLRGKRLGCFCFPDRECHGEVYVEHLNGTATVEDLVRRLTES